MSLTKTRCKICGAPAHGYHFGVITCRACAAFFRRALLTKKFRKQCQYDGCCTDFSGEKSPPCKSCRMRKCIRMGMSSKSLQVQHNTKIAQSLEIIVGRPHSIIFTTNDYKKRNYVDVNNLVSQAYQILKFGAPTPLNNKMSQLEKMAFGVTYSTKKCIKLDLISKESFSKIWEFDFFSAARWLTHLDDFSTLPLTIQMQLLQAIWHVFGRLYKTGKTADLRKHNGNKSKTMNLSDKYYVEMEKTKFDMSWLTHYPLEQIKLFLFGENENDCGSGKMIDTIISLELSEIELTYMTAQLCFQYAMSRFSGTEMSNICDRFQSILDNDLHKYYMRSSNLNKNYAWRLSQMLKINQNMQKSIRMHREKAIIARTFDIFIADYSHPEMFVDTGC
ncbi:unnamed protein product [Caenorhabditis brenneri]